MKIPLLDLKKQYKQFQEEAAGKVEDILTAQDFILGREVEDLEKNIARYCGTKYAAGVASGTDALILSLKAMGIGPGDEVITTPFTFIATSEAVSLVGAKPVFVDIDPKTYNMDPSLIEKKITPKTKAILPVHLYGLCADMDPILKIGKSHGLKIIEDTAQAIGSEYKGKKAGSISDAGALSFFPSKNLGAFGDAGMVVTNDENLYKMIKLLRVHGSDRRYYHDKIGYNSRLDNLQAAVLNIKLKYLDKWLDERINNAEFFNEELEGTGLITPHVPDGYKHSYHLYTLRSPQKSAIEEYLNNNGIEARTYYPVPLHMQKCFKCLGYEEGAFPNAEKASRDAFSIPVYPELTGQQKKYIVEKIMACIKLKK